MAEFQEVMRQFERMCLYFRRECKCPMSCPMNGLNISQCRKIAFEEPKVAENVIMIWAKEHPEPVYPSWLEWLTEKGIVFYKPVSETESRATIFVPLALTPIPADIAERLGIKPKDVTNDG